MSCEDAIEPAIELKEDRTKGRRDFYAKPPKPINDMTDEEKRDFAIAVLNALKKAAGRDDDG